MEGFDHRGIDVFVGVDMAKQDHYAHAVGRDASELFDRSVGNDEAAINRLIDDASGHGRVALVIDMPSSAAQLLLAVAREREVPVAYVTGLQVRRAAELYAGSAKTDPRDAGCWQTSRAATLISWCSRRQPGQQPLPRRADQHFPRS